MQVKAQLGVVTSAVVMVLAVFPQFSRACLRDTMDDRAVQWSTLIVIGKLSSVGIPTPMDSAAAAANSDSKSSANNEFQTYDFQITSCLDGAAKPGDHVSVIRFGAGAHAAESSICGQQLTASVVGKTFLLLLRPEADLSWSNSPDQPDPRTSQVHNLKAFMVVHLESIDDLGAEGLADAKYTITSTRQAEGQFKADDAKVQVQTMLEAADDTEEGQAEQAILQMGPKVLPVLKEALAGADDTGKAKLGKLILAVSPPSLMAGMKQH